MLVTVYTHFYLDPDVNYFFLQLYQCIKYGGLICSLEDLQEKVTIFGLSNWDSVGVFYLHNNGHIKRINSVPKDRMIGKTTTEVKSKTERYMEKSQFKIEEKRVLLSKLFSKMFQNPGK